jgi:hypothetical protein
MTSTDTITEAQAPFHMYGFEAWAPGQPGGASYPLQLPARIHVTAPDVPTAWARAALRTAPGWTLSLTSHHRAHCFPAHPGRD